MTSHSAIKPGSVEKLDVADIAKELAGCWSVGADHVGSLT